MNENGFIAKITRPRLSGIAPRERLFCLLDECRKKPVTWVSAPAGSGKTTLVASWLDSRKLPCLWYQVDGGDGDLASFFYYMGMAAKKAAPRHKKPLPLLTPEYLQGIPAFTKRYVEDLFSRLKPPFSIVLDNYQDVPLQSGFHEMIAHALESVPDGISVIILSRSGPPPQLSRLLVNSRMDLVGWDDVRFNLDESRDLLETQGCKRLSDEDLASLHAKTEGWAAGLILLTARTSSGRIVNYDPNGQIFDYFANEIFDKLDSLTQHFLLATAFLPGTTAVMAEQLTGVKEAGAILERLNKRHYFTQKHALGEPAYQYHALFREFLLARADHYFDAAERLFIKRKAARLLEASGRIEEAVALLGETKDWAVLTSLILREAQALAAQGRSQTLEGWIITVPEDIRNNNAWLLYWYGICRMLYDPVEARAHLEAAFEQFRMRDDVMALYMSWAAIIDTFFLEWNDFGPVAERWIPVFEALSRRHPTFPLELQARVKLNFFMALFWAQPSHPDLPEVAEQLMQILLDNDNSTLRFFIGPQLVHFYAWNGPINKAKLIFDLLQPAALRLDADPLALHLWFCSTSMLSWFRAEHNACLSIIAQGIALGEKTGVRVFESAMLVQGAFSAMSHEDMALAEHFHARIIVSDLFRKHDKAMYHNLAASLAWYRGDLKEAAEHGELSLRFAEESRFPIPIAMACLDLAITWFSMGRIEEAEQMCARALAGSAGLRQIECSCHLFRSWFAIEQGDETRGVASLRQAVTMGAELGFINFHRWRPGMMSRLCVVALEHGIEPKYVQQLIVLNKLPLPADVSMSLDSWPWPIRIYTLGKFEIVKDGKPVEFAGKVQKKPLELLKVIIALGGRNVGKEQLADALWSDAEGDLAHKSFEVTLFRLRRLLGTDKVLCYQNGMVTLDPGHCWIDIWAFEGIAGHLQKVEGRGEIGIDPSFEKAIELYRGDFLSADCNDLAVSARERIRSKFMRLIIMRGKCCEREGDWEKAAKYYSKGLEIDNLMEELYQHLMTCYKQLGRHAEVVKTYNSCRDALGKYLGIKPSARTEALKAG